MDRRGYLALLGAGLAGGSVGAASLLTGDQADPAGTSSGATTPAQRAPETPVPGALGPREPPSVPADPELPVPDSELDRAAPRDAIPAVVDPVFDASWAETDREIATETYPNPTLRPDERVIGLSREGFTRAYPLKLLTRHEVVNDTLDVPLLVSYCPICKSGLVARRRVDGVVRTFGVSGYLYSANLVLYDGATDSLWSQLLARAIQGPETGTRLTLTVSTTTTWRAWQDEHPDTTVMLPPPASGTVVGDVSLNYDLDPYGDHERIAERYPEYGPLGNIEWSDTRLRRRTPVLGLAHDGEAVAYPKSEIRGSGPINDAVGGRPVVVAMGEDETLVAYDRRAGGETLTFAAGDDGLLRAGGSRWRPLTGGALDGPYEGTTLTAVADVGELYWAAWLKFHPETTVYEG